MPFKDLNNAVSSSSLPLEPLLFLAGGPVWESAPVLGGPVWEWPEWVTLKSAPVLDGVEGVGVTDVSTVSLLL